VLYIAAGPLTKQWDGLAGLVVLIGIVIAVELPSTICAMALVAMERSLARVVLGSADATVVLPGHGPQTTIGVERATNPYLSAFGEPPRRGM
jgi:glyoxylase-like metal-dependent hydrolase (beta-lactamase superfamily II)